MRAVSVGADRALRVVDLPEPVPGPGEALIQVAYCGICGSDVHMRPLPQFFPDGTVPGHEFSGRIARLGPSEERSEWAVGQRVAVLPFGQCGECALCRSGDEQAVIPAATPSGCSSINECCSRSLIRSATAMPRWSSRRRWPCAASRRPGPPPMHGSP
jgi:threonine dehydrogenase-like Zn-dependent dehydrogenase